MTLAAVRGGAQASGRAVGGLAVGQQADFTVLEQDPFEVAPEALRDIPIWGTVFEGRPFPIAR